MPSQTCQKEPGCRLPASTSKLPFQINTTALFPSLHPTAAFLFPLLPSALSLLHFAPTLPAPSSITSSLCSPKAQMSLHSSYTSQYDCSQSNELLNLGELPSLEMVLMIKQNKTSQKKSMPVRTGEDAWSSGNST